MKLSKSKLALAKVINENGGWPERALWAVQDNCIAFFLGGKPEYKSGDRYWYSNSIDGACVWTITCDEKVTNWHQTILSREEYYHAYPNVDADWWIEHDGKHEPAVATSGLTLWCRWSDGLEQSHEANMVDWIDDSDVRIIAYRLHNPEVKPELCESVMRSITEPEAKPTIEQLAQDYRHAKEYAERLQKEANEANDKSEAIRVALINAGADIGIVISRARAGDELEYKIGEKWFLVSVLKEAGWTDLQLSDYQSR